MRVTSQRFGQDVRYLHRCALVLVSHDAIEQELPLEVILTCDVFSALIVRCRSSCKRDSGHIINQNWTLVGELQLECSEKFALR